MVGARVSVRLASKFNHTRMLHQYDIAAYVICRTYLTHCRHHELGAWLESRI